MLFNSFILYHNIISYVKCFLIKFILHTELFMLLYKYKLLFGLVIIMKLNEKIKKIRSENNLSQKEFAKKVGISISSVQKYEYGDVKPSSEVIYKILKAFDISENIFLSDTEMSEEEKTFFKMDTELFEAIDESFKENKRNLDLIFDNLDYEIDYSEKAVANMLIYNGDLTITYNSANKDFPVNVKFFEPSHIDYNKFSNFSTDLTLNEFIDFLDLLNISITNNAYSLLYFKK